jgi:hypothetical protein
MSAEFTAITPGLDWQDLAFVNEIVNAYSERSQAIGGDAVSAAEAGADLQSVSFWETIQDWIETNCVSFVDYTQTDTGLPSGKFVGKSSIPLFTLAAFQAAADLEDGFRRATEWVPDASDPDWETDVTFSYGKMQEGDIIGPWILADLQKAFTALAQTRYDNPEIITNTEKLTYQSTDLGDYDITAARADWVAESWWDSVGKYGVGTSREDSGSSSVWGAVRYNIDVLRFTFATFRPCSCDIYAKANLVTAEGNTFLDFDGLGLIEEEYARIGQLAESSDATRDSDVLAPSTDTPFAISGFSLQKPSCSVYSTSGVVKWNFSNS